MMCLCKAERAIWLPILVMFLLTCSSFYPAIVDNAAIEIEYPDATRSHTISSQITENVKYEDRRITVSEGIEIINGGNLTIENCTVVFTADQIGIAAKADSSLTIIDSYIYSFTDCSWWIAGERGSHLLIENSELVGSRTRENGAIKIATNYAKVVDCIISDFGGDIIDIHDCQGTEILRNTISRSTKEGINIVSAHNTYVINNSISDTGFCGIYSLRTEGLRIIGNDFKRTTYNGIVFVNSEKALVDANSFSNIALDCVGMEYCNEITISGNMLLNSNSSGIGSLHSSTIIISDNYISGTRWYGVDLREESEKVQLGCNSIRETGVGMYIEDTSNVTVIGNLVNMSLYADIRLHSSDDINVYLNGFCSDIVDLADPLASHIKWDNDTVGNYWYRYQGEDNDADGIGDTMYVIDEGNYDFYPLMTIQPILEFIETHSSLPPSHGTQSTETGGSNNGIIPLNDDQLSLILLANSIVQLIAIALVLIIILYKRRGA